MEKSVNLGKYPMMTEKPGPQNTIWNTGTKKTRLRKPEFFLYLFIVNQYNNPAGCIEKKRHLFCYRKSSTKDTGDIRIASQKKLYLSKFYSYEENYLFIIAFHYRIRLWCQANPNHVE